MNTEDFKLIMKIASELKLIRKIMYADLLERHGYSVQGKVKELVKSGDYTEKEGRC